MAGAEGAVVVSRVRERHAAQVRADADDHHELRFEAALLVRLLVAEVLHQHGCLLEHTHVCIIQWLLLGGVVVTEGYKWGTAGSPWVATATAIATAAAAVTTTAKCIGNGKKQQLSLGVSSNCRVSIYTMDRCIMAQEAAETGWVGMKLDNIRTCPFQEYKMCDVYTYCCNVCGT